MKLKQKSSLMVGISFLFLFIILYSLTHGIILRNYINLEEKLAKKDLQRAVKALEGNINFIDMLTVDWAVWDDSYQFMQDRNMEYIRSNLVPSTFSGLNLDAILLINNDLEVFYGHGYDRDEDDIKQLPEGLLDILREKRQEFSHSDVRSSISGILMLPAGPMLMSSRPITTSEYKGPAQGSFIMGRFLSDGEMEKISDSTSLPLQYKVISEGLSGEYQEALKAIDSRGTEFLDKVTKDTINAYTILPDIFGNPAIILQCTLNRDVYLQGMTSLRYFTISILIVGLALSVLTWTLLQRFVISKLTSLSGDLSDIILSSDHSARVKVQGDDELASISKDINSMLQSLESSGEEFNKSIINSLHEHLAVLDLDGNLISTNDTWKDFARSEGGFWNDCGKAGSNLLSAIVAHGDAYWYSEKIRKAWNKSLESPLDSTSVEFEGIGHDKGWFLVNFSQFTGRGGGIVITIMDISALKLAEKKLMESLNESQSRLREVHHRVKNNLQIIYSLHNIQKGIISNPEAINVLRDSMGRIKSMALLHEKIYMTENLSNITVDDYLISVVHGLLGTYNAAEIEFTHKIDKTEMSIDTLVPLGLIVNEIITNSLKHAFGSNREKKIFLNVTYLNKGIELEIGDNGTGLPGEIDIYNPATFGFRIVKALVAQLDGKIDYKDSHGAMFYISFPLS